MKILPELSVIVPVFNMEQFIERCLISILRQDLPKEKLEVIVINDGSTDRSKQIVEELQEEFANLILFDQENKGVSLARNAGMEIARGNYILFIDADDFIEQNSCGWALDIMNRQSLDILFLQMSVIDRAGRFLGQKDYNAVHDRIFNGIDAYIITHRENEKDPDTSCGIIYNKAFLQKRNLRFLEGVPYLEDGLFIGKVMCFAERCSFNSAPFYFRTINPGSASNSNLYNTTNARQGFIKAAKDIEAFSVLFDFTERQLGLMNQLLAKFVISSIISSIGSKKLSAMRKIRNELRVLGYRKLPTMGLISNNAYVSTFNISFWFFITYYIVETRLRILKSLIANTR